MCDTCWVAMKRGDHRLGGALWFTHDLVITAAHCLGREPQVGDTLEVHTAKAVTLDETIQPIFGGSAGEVLDGTVIELPGADIALIELALPEEPNRSVPFTGEATLETRWRTTYRPDMSNGSLSGTVAIPSERMLINGAIVSVIHLECPAGHDSHKGFSGSPVENLRRPLSVLGILVRQQPKRGNPTKSAQILYALPIREVLSRLKKFSNRAMLEELLPNAFRETTDDGHRPNNDADGGPARQDFLPAHHVSGIGPSVTRSTGDAHD
ncbi:hypothetical protein AQJ23_28665 [Streptomyces antibioticus]|nr:serine protease [Streptomyces antibioticus]KUN22028.1 hypothetical protein AQJ23_28665 [Streptomyces antibioticus]